MSQQSSKVLTGVILSYRRGPNEQYENQVLVEVDGVSRRSEASRLIGWRVYARDAKGNVYRGKVVGVHGNRGVVVVRFKPNIPGQLLGSTVFLVPPGVVLEWE